MALDATIVKDEQTALGGTPAAGRLTAAKTSSVDISNNTTAQDTPATAATAGDTLVTTQDTPATTATAGDTPVTTDDASVVPQDIGDQGERSKHYSKLAGQRMEQDVEFDPYKQTQESGEVTAGEKFLTPETTVAGQLESILGKESPLQRMAATRAKEQASALGMMSSSSGIGASQRALYDSAMPIAQQDAKTAATQKTIEQEAVNQKRQIDQEAIVSGDLTLQKANLQEQQEKIDSGFALAMKGLDADTEEFMLGQKAYWEKDIASNQADLEEKLRDSKLKAETEVLLMNQAQEAVNQVQISIQQLMASDTFLDNMTQADLGPDGELGGGDDLDAGTTLKAYMNKIAMTGTAAIRFNALNAGLYTPSFQAYLNQTLTGIQW